MLNHYVTDNYEKGPVEPAAPGPYVRRLPIQLISIARQHRNMLQRKQDIQKDLADSSGQADSEPGKFRRFGFTLP